MGEVIAVLGLPALAGVLGGAGYDVLVDDPAGVPKTSKPGNPVIVIAGGPDPMARISATSRAASGGVVAWIGVDGSPPAPAGTIDFPAPIRVGDILAVLGVTVMDDAVADAYVMEDGSVRDQSQDLELPVPDFVKPRMRGIKVGEGTPQVVFPAPVTEQLSRNGDHVDSAATGMRRDDSGLWDELITDDDPVAGNEGGIGARPPTRAVGASHIPHPTASSPAPIAPAPAVAVEPSGADADDLWLTPDGARPRRQGHGLVVVLVAQKGGLGVSSFSVAVAERSASAGHRTVLVDATGRDDLRPVLWVPDGALPTVYDAHLQGDPRAGIAMPTDLSQARPDGLPDLHFGVVLGPPAVVGRDRATPHALGPKDWSVYASVISVARSAADLVVVVTSCPSAPAYRSIVAPPVLCAGVADDSRDGFSRLVSWWGELGAEEPGVLRAVLLNRVSSPPVIRVEAVERAASGYGAGLLGPVPEKREIKQATSSGHLSDDVDWLSAVDKCLELVKRTPVRGSVQ